MVAAAIANIFYIVAFLWCGLIFSVFRCIHGSKLTKQSLINPFLKIAACSCGNQSYKFIGDVIRQCHDSII